MSTTITIRAEQSLRDALVKRAKSSGKSLSELVREILEQALAEKAFKSRAGYLKGRLAPALKASEPWIAQLRERNWRS